MDVLALYNLKGGVGKTASAVNLAYAASRAGRRTLLWDLDPQGAATFYFRVEPRLESTPSRLLSKRGDLAGSIRASDYPDLDLVPADFSLRMLDVAMGERKDPARRLRRLLEPLAAEYDVVFLDCPPSISLALESVFAVASALLVPLIPTTLSLRTLEQLRSHLEASGPHDLPVWPFFCMVDRRKTLHRDVLLDSASDPDAFPVAIPYASDVERMGIERRPIATFAPRGVAARSYEALWQELAERLDP